MIPPPPPPTNLSAYCAADGRTGYMTWTPSAGATGYYIRANDRATPWAPPCTSNSPDGNGDICTPPIGGVPPFTWSTTQGRTYDVWVHSNGPGGYSSAVSASFTCAAPATATLTATPATIMQGATSTLSWTTTGATGGVSITTVGGNLSANGSTPVYPSQTTTYTLTAMSPAGNATRSATVTVLRSCTLDGQTIPHGQSRTFYSHTTAPSGQICSALSQTRTCTDGALSGSATYSYAACSCVVSSAYSCSGTTIVRTTTNADCSTTITNPYLSCTAPAFCSPDSALCLYPNPSFTPGPGTLTGHLQVRPTLVRAGQTAKVYWNLANVQSCTVTGDNGDSWTGASSGASGKTTAPITRTTTYSLSCTSYPGATPTTITESGESKDRTVRITPTFRER